MCLSRDLQSFQSWLQCGCWWAVVCSFVRLSDRCSSTLQTSRTSSQFKNQDLTDRHCRMRPTTTRCFSSNIQIANSSTTWVSLLSLSHLSTTRHSFPTHAHYDGPVVINLKTRLSLHSCQFFLGVIECLITFASSLLLSFAKNYGEDPNGLVFLFLLFHNLLELKLHREWKWNYICVGVVLW
jgi:hypothetical protein